MSSDEEGDWRSMRRRVPPAAPKSGSKPTISPASKKHDDGVVACLPGGLTFVRPSSQSIKPRLQLSEPVLAEDDPNPKDRKIRRGEVGKDMNEVVKLESSGFVMTGSRSSRMNMLREIKEAETVTEDQRREQLLDKVKARADKEEELISGFRALLRNRQN